MNRFETNDTGKMPVALDDYRFMQQAWRELGDAIYREFGITPATAVIISGIEQSDGGATFDYTEGFAYMNGEVFKFEAASVTKPTGGNDHFLLIQETVDPNGNKVFQDAVSHDTYFVRKVVIQVAPTGAPPANSITFDLIDLRRVPDLRDNNLIHQMDDVGTKTVTPAPVLIHQITPSATKNSGVMAIRWSARVFHANTGGTNALVATFTIKKNGTPIKFTSQTLFDDGQQHSVTLLGQVSYSAGDTIEIEGATDLTAYEVTESTLEVQSVDAVTP